MGIYHSFPYSQAYAQLVRTYAQNNSILHMYYLAVGTHFSFTVGILVVQKYQPPDTICYLT